jgi:hypothetical protein
MKKQRQNVWSTKIKVLTVQSEPKEGQQHVQHEVYIKIYNAHDTIYTDQTANGMDANCIEPRKSPGDGNFRSQQ